MYKVVSSGVHPANDGHPFFSKEEKISILGSHRDLVVSCFAQLNSIDSTRQIRFSDRIQSFMSCPSHSPLITKSILYIIYEVVPVFVYLLSAR
jgi:hypothetical protein